MPLHSTSHHCVTGDVNTLRERADCLCANGEMESANALIDVLIHSFPYDSSVWNSYGVILEKSNVTNDAFAAYQQALILNPANAEAANNLGVLHYKANDASLGICFVVKALCNNPDFTHAVNNLFLMMSHYSEAQRFQEVFRVVSHYETNDMFADEITFIDQIISKFDGFYRSQLIHCVGIACYQLGDYEAAMKHYREALLLQPGFGMVFNSLGFLYRDLGKFDEALQAFEDAVHFDPNSEISRLNLGMMQLQLGDWEAGWENYESRWVGSAEAVRGSLSRFSHSSPCWDGDFADSGIKSLLVLGEQGYGDVLQFSRLLPSLIAKFKRVGLYVSKPLRALMASSFGPQLMILDDLDVNHFEWSYHVHIMSLPRLLKLKGDKYEGAFPYLSVRASLSDLWARSLPISENSRVGVCWSGSQTHKFDKRRSIRAELIKPMLAIDTVQWVSLQKDLYDRNSLGDTNCNFYAIDQCQDFADTAALIGQLDLVITVDTSIAHLAGAMNKPVWLLNYIPGDWRWQVGRTSTSWYPTMKIFNQAKLNYWEDVVNKVISAVDCVFCTNSKKAL